MRERLHKILAHAGFGSRRHCEELIAAGRVTVGGNVVTVGDKAEPGTDDIRVDGRRVRVERKVYYVLNKPPGYLCTNDDPAGRRLARDLLEAVRERVYPVGRLDADSRGLVIMTNDGELAARLTHPSYEVPKTYEVEVDGRVESDEARKLAEGVWLSEGRTGRARVRVLRRGNARSLLEVTLREGRNRQVRRMLAKLGHKVRRLTRTRIGRLTLHGLGPGKFRELAADEVDALYRATAGRERRHKAEARGGKSVGRAAVPAARKERAGRKQREKGAGAGKDAAHRQRKARTKKSGTERSGRILDFTR